MDNLGKIGRLMDNWGKIRQLINILFCGYQRRLEIADPLNDAETYILVWGTGCPSESKCNVQRSNSFENRRSARPAKSFLLQYLAIYKFISRVFLYLQLVNVFKVLLTEQRNSVKQHYARAQTVLTCQQQHENTQV
jgi:hypothetical protein